MFLGLRTFVRAAVPATAALLLLAVAQPAAAQPTVPPVVISQVYGGGGNSGATLTHDYIELFNYGPDPVPLTGWSVQYASAAGSNWQRTDLAGTLQPGQYFLIQQARGAGGSVSLPLPDATGAIAMAAGAGKVALVSQQTSLTCGAAPGDCFPNAAIVDFVGYGTANNFEGSGAAPGLGNTTAALRLGGGCADTNQNNADFISGTPAPRNSAVIDPGCEPPEPPTCTPDATIAEVQGSGQASPFVGEAVSVAGIVTGRISIGSSRGFFLQMAEGDGNPATSDGIFVFTGSTTPSPDAQIGNEVCVRADVAEFVPASDPGSLPLSELSRPTAVTLIGTERPLPAPIALTSADVPSTDAGALERLEGMRVHVASLTAIAPTDGGVSEPNATSLTNGVFYGVLTGVARPFREPGIDIFDLLPPGAPASLPRFDSNPERIRVDSDALGAPALDVATGAVISNLVGPLHYAFRTYSVFPDAAGTPTVGGPASAAVAVPLPTARELTVATTNLERLFDTVDDPIGDPVVTPAGLERRLAKMSLAVRTVLRSPDIIGVQEAENLSVLEMLAARVNADTQAQGSPNPGYEARLEEGNDIGGIDVGFLVKTSRVQIASVEQIGKDATFVNPDGETELLNDRPSLVLHAVVSLPAGTLPVTVIVNHLRSLIDIETADAGPRVRAKRQAQAEFLAADIQARQQANPQERLIVVGDFNAFQVNDGYVDVMGTIAGRPAPADQVLLASGDLVNPDLVDGIELLSPTARYSYVFDGNAQVLDHVLLNPAALANLTRVAIARNNADFPETLRNDATRPERYSDHDITVAYFQLMPTDVSAQVLTVATPAVCLPRSEICLGAVVAQNASAQPIAGPVHLAIEGLPSGVTLANADGMLNGVPYVTVPFTTPFRPWFVSAVVLQFRNPGRVPIRYVVRPLAGAF